MSELSQKQKVIKETTTIVEIKESYELTTDLGIIKRMLIGILCYWQYAIMGKKVTFTLTKRYEENK